MAQTDDLSKARARRAYELGRLRRALRFSIYPLPLVALSGHACGTPLTSGLAGALLVISVVFLAWRGGAYESAIVPGLAAGLGAFAVPFAGHFLGCDGVTRFTSASLCFLGGVLTGAFLGARCLRQPLHRGRFLAAGCAIAMLVGALGCVLAGLGGVLGMMLGVTSVSIPAVLLVRRA